MATYKKFSELPEITEASEYTKVPVLDGNEMKLLNGAKLGGDAGIKTAIFKDSNYDKVIAGEEISEDVTITCTNMTFEEAYEIMVNGEPLMAVAMTLPDLSVPITECNVCTINFATYAVGVPCIAIKCNEAFLFWTTNGFSTTPPSSGGGES